VVIAAAGPGPVSGPAARHAARVELGHHEYQRDRPSLLSRAISWIGRHLDSVLSGGSGGGAFVVVVVILLAVLIFFAVRSGVPRLRVRAQRDDADPLAPVAARDHRRIATELTAAGRRSEALREWLRAAVQAIEDRGVLPPRPGRTGAATAREAGPLLPSAATDLVAATAAFDEVWFGGRPATDADVARARAAADGVMNARIVRTAAPSGLAVPQ
jgi:hypothetical protein